jgi:hypothetical protein
MSYPAGLPCFYETMMSLVPILPPEATERVYLSSDLCIAGNWFCVRGCIEIPVIDADEPFIWGAWVTISRENYARIVKLWDNPERIYERPYKGLLAHSIPGYRKTLFLKARVHSRPVGERPLIELGRSKSKLAIEQHEGISMARVQEIAEMMLHGDSNSLDQAPSAWLKNT